MFAATSASSRVLAAPTTSRAAKAGGVRRVAARASASEDKRAPVPIAPSRRAFAAAGLAAAAAALSPRAALAFGNGIPGYDINEKARDAQAQGDQGRARGAEGAGAIGKGEEASGESRRGSRRGGGAELKRLTDSFRVHEGKRTQKKHKSDRRRLKRVEVQNSHATFVVSSRARASSQTRVRSRV